MLSTQDNEYVGQFYMFVLYIFKALATAEDAENCLTDEWEKEQNQALESAIQEEESWLKVNFWLYNINTCSLFFYHQIFALLLMW